MKNKLFFSIIIILALGIPFAACLKIICEDEDCLLNAFFCKAEPLCYALLAPDNTPVRRVIIQDKCVPSSENQIISYIERQEKSPPSPLV